MEVSKVIAKAGALTVPAGTAVALVALQFVLFGLAADLLSSVAIFGLGYAACWLTRRRQAAD